MVRRDRLSIISDGGSSIERINGIGNENLSSFYNLIYIEMSNSLFKDFAESRSRMVWFPGYTPLWQKVLEDKPVKSNRNAYAKEYYAKHREEILRKQRERWHAKKKVEVTRKKMDDAKDKLVEIQDGLSKDYIKKLEDDNYKLRDEIEELKVMIKFLFKYFK